MANLTACFTFTEHSFIDTIWSTHIRKARNAEDFEGDLLAILYRDGPEAPWKVTVRLRRCGAANGRPEPVARTRSEDAMKTAWVLRWQTARMWAPAFWYFATQTEAEACAARLRKGTKADIEETRVPDEFELDESDSRELPPSPIEDFARALDAAPKVAEAPFALTSEVVHTNGKQGGLFWCA